MRYKTVMLPYKVHSTIFIRFRHSDQVKIFAGDANGQDFWGMEDFQFVLNDCSRNTQSFERGPTAFIANLNGPIRTIR